MEWIVRPQLHLCQIGDRFVGLDLSIDRYFLLGGALAQQIHRFRDRRASQSDLVALAERRIIEKGDPDKAPNSAAVLPPRLSLAVERSRGGENLLMIQSIIAQIQTRRRLSRDPPAVVLEGLRREMLTAQIPAPSDCMDVIIAFRRARRFYSQTDQCLACGIAMSRMLARRGAQVQLVIGVALPFVAHCWLQVHDTVLSDTVDHVRAYTPIFAL